VIVADASAVAELLLARPTAPKVSATLSHHTELHVPEHFHVELLSVLRRYSLRGELTQRRAAQARAALAELRAIRYPVMDLAEEIWDLRNELTACDAAYLALAGRLNVELVTMDEGLAKSASRHGRLVSL
jgi:predicted nucleic acid-binding protein